MRLDFAKERVLALMQADLLRACAVVPFDARSPDPTDFGKLVIHGKPARVVVRHSGWHPHISRDWLGGGFALPRIQSSEFYWYVFYLHKYGGFQREHYFICDFLQMREWVQEFAAAHPGAHADHDDWMAAFHRLDPRDEQRAYFRWGDEPVGATPFASRAIQLDNVLALVKQQEHVARFGIGGESEAHRQLKLYIAGRPKLLGLSESAIASVEHSFLTGDRVDVMFGNHGPKRSVVEVEVDGEENLMVGVHQAIKYRALAAAQDGFALVDPTVRAYVVAYETAYKRPVDLAARYDVRLVTVERSSVIKLVA